MPEKVITHELRGEADLSTATMRLATARTSPEFSASLHESRFRSTIVHRLPTPVGDPCQLLLLCIPSIDPPPRNPCFRLQRTAPLSRPKPYAAHEFFSDQFPAIGVIYRDTKRDRNSISFSFMLCAPFFSGLQFGELIF